MINFLFKKKKEAVAKEIRQVDDDILNYLIEIREKEYKNHLMLSDVYRRINDTMLSSIVAIDKKNIKELDKIIDTVYLEYNYLEHNYTKLSLRKLKEISYDRTKLFDRIKDYESILDIFDYISIHHKFIRGDDI